VSTYVPRDHDYDEDAAFGTLKTLLKIHDKTICTMSWAELGDLTSALQSEFSKLVIFSTEAGFSPLIDFEDILLEVMGRVGFWALHRVRLTESESAEAVRCMYDVDEDEFSRLRLAVICETLDGVHSMWSALLTLTRATVLQPEGTAAEVIQRTPIFNHHREASIDDFYELSMVADLGPGAIIQYKNKFRFLFHSVSQVIYFHYPAYDRQVQRPLHEIVCYGSPANSLLPLLRQIDPDIPVLYEHTGAGHAPTHSNLKWSWVLAGGHIVLVSRDGSAFCAEDLRVLHEHAHTKEQ
tara:strand:+ start:7569 stop:8453 length:885 start_codon:yes stop_codon:yes gene_type:complete